MTQYSKMTFEEFVAYAKDYTIDGCHPQIVDEAIARLNSLHGDNKELKTENQILSQKRFNIFERIEYSDKLKIKAYKECIEKVKREIAEALESNYKARAERIDKHNVGDKTDFISYCGGKIDCLRGLDDFLNNLLKEKVGEDK